MNFLLSSLMLLFLSITIYGEEFEDSTNLCSERCKCEFSEDKMTVTINCSDTRMHNTIANWPTSTANVNNIIAIFRDNEITTLEEMPGTKAELKLVFSNCGIKYLNTGLFESSVNVKYLDLSHNLIENDQLSADVFKGPYNNTEFRPIALEYLSLAYNLLHSLQKDMFEHTPNLKVLNLEGNQLRVLDHITSISFSNIPKLQNLNLAHNQLTEIPINAIEHFKGSLTELNIAFNDLDFVPVSLAYLSETLQVLNISSNPIIEFNNDSFEGLQNLLKLYAANMTELTVVRAEAFAGLKKLQTLKLFNNHKLFEIDENAFGETSLQELYLNDNSLTHLDITMLPWSQLRVLDLRGNHLYCDCDLYNISQQLNDIIKRDRDGPYCLDGQIYIAREVYNLKSDVCDTWSLDGTNPKSLYIRSMTLMRITLSVLMVLLIISTAIAIWLAITKWKTYKRSLNYPFPNQVVYNPISTFESRY